MEISKKARLGLVIALVLIALPVVFAATYTVCSSGCTYSDITSCLTAINNTAGNTCVLNTSITYTINNALHFNIIESGSNPAILFDASYSSLDCNHSTISGDGNGYGIHMGTAGWYKNNDQVRNCRIANYSNGIYANAYYMPPTCAGYYTISNNIFENANLYLDCVSSSSITGNKFYSAGLTSYAYQFGNGGFSNSRNYIANNEFDSSSGIYLYGMLYNNIISNNIINASSYGIYIAQVPSTSLGYYPSYPTNTTNITVMNNKINAGTYGIQTNGATYGTISNNTFHTSSESLYLSSSKHIDISLNNFLTAAVYDNTGLNSYCVNSEGNFYEKSLTPASGDCGPASITPPITVIPSSANITWTRQSSSLPVTYDVNLTDLSTASEMKVYNTTGLYYDKANFTVGKTYIIKIIPWVNDSVIEGTISSATFTICPTPSDNYYVNKNTVLCQKAYQLNDTGSDGVLIINASDITLDCNGATLIGNNIGKGVDVTRFNNVTIKNCNLHNYTNDIYIDHSNYLEIRNNNLFTNILSGWPNYYAIYSTYSSYPEITTNNITAYYGIYLEYSQNPTITNNNIHSSSDGVHTHYSDAADIVNNLLSSNDSNSISLYSTPHSEIRNNLIYDNLSAMFSGGLSQKGQVYVEYSPVTNIINNTCRFCGGFQFYQSDNSSALNNTITDLSYASNGLLDSERSNNILFQGNNITNTMGLLGAVHISNSANVTVEKNIIENNFIAHMSVQDSSDIFIANNTMISTSDAWYLKNVSEIASNILGLNYTGPGAQLPFIVMMFEQLIPLLGGGTFSVTGGNITGLNADLATLMGGGVLGPLLYTNSERVNFIDNVVSYGGFKISIPMNASTVDIKNNVLSANIGVGMFDIYDSTIKNNLFVLNNSGLFVDVSGNRLNLDNNSADMGFIGTVVSGENNLFSDNDIIMDNVAVDFILNSNFSQIENLGVGGTVYGLGILGANITVQNNQINVNDVGLHVHVYGNATEFSNVNITPLHVGLLELSAAGNSTIFNNTGSISSSGILLELHPDVSADVQHLVFSDAAAATLLLMNSDSNTIIKNRFAIRGVGINASVSNEHINFVESKNLTFAGLILKTGSIGNKIINNTFSNSSLPSLAFSWNPNNAANSSIFVGVYGAEISSDSPNNYFAHNNFKNMLADTSELNSAFSPSLNNNIMVEKAGIAVESSNNTLYANTIYNPGSNDVLLFGKNNTLLLNHLLSGGVSGTSGHYASYSPIYYNGENFSDTYSFVIPGVGTQVVTADNTLITSANGTNSYDLLLFNDTVNLLGQGAGKMSTALCLGCYANGVTSCAVLDSLMHSSGACRYYKQNAFTPHGTASDYSWADTFNSSYHVISGNPTPPYLVAKTAVSSFNTFCVNGSGNFYEEDLTPIKGDCGPANITTFSIRGGRTNVFWKKQSAHSPVTYDVLVNNTVTGKVYKIGSTTATNFSIDTTTYDSSNFGVELMPWITDGLRFNGTHATSPFFTPGITITYPAAGSTVNGTVTITFIGTNSSPEISFDGGNWTSTTGVNSHIWDTTEFTVGTHSIQVREFIGTAFTYSKTVLVNVAKSAPALPVNGTLVVYDEGNWSRHNSSLYAHWTTNLTGSFAYSYKIKDVTVGSYIRDWTGVGSAMSVNATGLTLTNNHNYKFEVKMSAGSGNYSWVNVTNGIQPGKRVGFMAFDSKRNNIILFGGEGYIGASPFILNDTWKYNSATQTWTKLTEAGPGRRLMPIVYDSARDRIIGFGGLSLTQSFNETWEFNPNTNTWTNITTTGVPPAGAGSMVYDSLRDKVVLFMGASSTSTSINETWEYNPGTSTWTKINTATPSSRMVFSMAYIEDKGVSVLFGGIDFSTLTFLNDTWLYNGSTQKWTQLFPGASPSGRLAPMAYDSDENKVVLYGGESLVPPSTSPQFLNGTWEFDLNANKWAKINATGPPSAFGMLSYDNNKNAVIAFMGLNVWTGSYNETWELPASLVQIANASSDGIKVDTIPPTTTLTSSTHPDQNATYYSTSASFSWTASDTPSGIYGFSYAIDSNPLTMPDNAIELPSTATSLTITVSSGTNYFHLKTLDNAGNYVVKHFKLTVVAAGAVNVILHPYESPTKKDLIDLKGTISQNVTNMTLFVNGLTSPVKVHLNLSNLEFEFNNVSIPMGINAIYAVSYINSTAVGTSNTIYVKRILETRVNVTELTIECSSCGSAASRLTYASAVNQIPGTSRYPKYGAGTDTSGTPVSGGTVTGSPDADTFIFITKPEAPLDERNNLLENQKLFDEISPSLGFILDPKNYQVSIILNYADMSISGQQEKQEGNYNLVIKNNGLVKGVPNVSIEIT